MGNPKQKWTPEEEEALRAGVAKHGTGKWKNIQRDPEFNHLLYSRSNIDLKDKWRNLSVNALGQGSRDKLRPLKQKVSVDVPARQTSPSPVVQDTPAPVETVVDDHSKSSLDVKTVSATKCNSMIFEALTTMKEPNGSDTAAIVKFIEKSYEVPPHFRRQVSSRLRRLLSQDKLEKVQNCFKIKKDFVLRTKTPLLLQKEISVKPSPSTSRGPYSETLDEAALTAAYKIAEAENKSFVAAEAVKEAERVARMDEDATSLLQFAKDLFEKCSSGEIVLMA